MSLLGLFFIPRFDLPPSSPSSFPSPGAVNGIVPPLIPAARRPRAFARPPGRDRLLRYGAHEAVRPAPRPREGLRHGPPDVVLCGLRYQPRQGNDAGARGHCGVTVVWVC